MAHACESDFWAGLPFFLANKYIEEEMPRIEEQLEKFSAIHVLQETKGRWTKSHLADFIHNRVDFVPVVMEKLWAGSDLDQHIYQHLHSWTSIDDGWQTKEALKNADHVMHRKFSFTPTWSYNLATAFRAALFNRVDQMKWYEKRLREFRVQGRKITAMNQVMDA